MKIMLFGLVMIGLSCASVYKHENYGNLFPAGYASGYRNGCSSILNALPGDIPGLDLTEDQVSKNYLFAKSNYCEQQYWLIMQHNLKREHYLQYLKSIGINQNDLVKYGVDPI